jgi:5-carboxymethyl-2-hydroxymuconate isomerase
LRRSRERMRSSGEKMEAQSLKGNIHAENKQRNFSFSSRVRANDENCLLKHKHMHARAQRLCNNHKS